MKSFISFAALAVASGLAVSTASAQITIPTVPVGDPSNATDPTTGYGSVAYMYNIGTTEVTNAQYAAFLNAVAAADPFDLYNADMAGSMGGIIRSGSPGSYTYSTVSGRVNNPVNYVSFWDACRFANWLHNGQGSGDTETGAYTLTPAGIYANTITRNTGWQWAVTSEDEWYKAAYYQPASAGGDADNYWLYPTSSNTIDFADSNSNSFDSVPVGSYVANFYGTFDMAGNLAEWNESITGIFGAFRGVRGGSYEFIDGSVNDFRRATDPWLGFAPEDDGLLGFRVVQIPAPSAAFLVLPGFLAAARRRRAMTSGVQRPCRL
jgi:formylglycine-generating enzyme required for sulfatase activity